MSRRANKQINPLTPRRQARRMLSILRSRPEETMQPSDGLKRKIAKKRRLKCKAQHDSRKRNRKI